MKEIIITVFCIVANIPFGIWRNSVPKFSVKWFVAIHAPVPAVICLRLLFNTNSYFIPLFILASVLGQFIGGKIKQIKKRE